MSPRQRNLRRRTSQTPAGLLLLVVLALGACSTAPTAPATVVPITDYRVVAGRWHGTVLGLAGPRQDEGDWVQVTIGEDGTYDFGAYRTIGVFGGKGKLALKDGKLTAEGERGQGTFTLYERGGKQFLRVEGILRPNTPISGELGRAK